MDDETLQLLAKLGAGVASAAVAIIGAWPKVSKWYRLRSQRTAEEKMLAFSTMSNELQSAVGAVGASYGILLKASNGGATPAATFASVRRGKGELVFASIMMRASSLDLDSVLRGWNRAELDIHYLEILADLELAKVAHLKTKALPEKSLLRSSYEGIGVSESIIVEVCSVSGGYWYAAFAFEDSPFASHDAQGHAATSTVYALTNAARAIAASVRELHR
jgi:hypothetical protein